MRSRLLLAFCSLIFLSGITQSAEAFQPELTKPLVPCQGNWLCGYVAVPVSYGTHNPGFLELQVKELLAADGSTGTAVVGLAGGPGQAAIPFANSIAANMTPYLAHDDLIVFDQRGTGNTALYCGRNIQNATSPTPSALAQCARKIGKDAPYFSSQESADDINTIRESLGEKSLIIYGVSYGTLVAQAYAQDFPDFTRSLVLDSVVPLGGGDPLGRQNLDAMPTVLDGFCSGACSWLHKKLPSTYFARLLKESKNGPVQGAFYNGEGHLANYSISQEDIINLMIDEATNTSYAQQLPAAIIAAAQGHGQLLYEMTEVANANGQGSNLLAGFQNTHPKDSYSVQARQLSGALYWATTCEDIPEPWTRRTPYKKRVADLINYINSQPISSFDGFSKTAIWYLSSLPDCAGWPTVSSPLPHLQNPDIPVLILHGSEDDLTPLASAQRVADSFPLATLVTVPQTGHDVLDTEPETCGSEAVAAFAASQPINTSCPSSLTKVIAPTPPLPYSLNEVKGRTTTSRLLHAASLCIANALEFAGADGQLSLGGFFQGNVVLNVSDHGSVQITSFKNYSCIKGTSITGNLIQDTLSQANASYFLVRGDGKKEVFSFNNFTLTSSNGISVPVVVLGQ